MGDITLTTAKVLGLLELWNKITKGLAKEQGRESASLANNS